MKKGDILVWKSGYSMILASFYEVLEVSATGKSVKIQEIDSRYRNPAPGAETAVPAEEKRYTGKVLQKRVRSNECGEFLTMRPYAGYVRLWDGHPVHVDTYD